MKSEHIQYLRPKLERLAELTREFVPLVNELEHYSTTHNLPDDEIETLAVSIAPDIEDLFVQPS